MADDSFVDFIFRFTLVAIVLVFALPLAELGLRYRRGRRG